MANAMLPTKAIVSSVITMMTNPTSGRTSNGMAALEITVTVSDTGSDFQKRMLRSRRSL